MATAKPKYKGRPYSSNKKSNTDMGILPIPKGKFRLALLPILITLTIIPFITRVKSFDKVTDDYYFLTANYEYSDVFSYYKMMFFIGITVICLAVLLYQKFIEKRKFKMNILFIPLCIYAALTLLSGIMAEYPKYALWGFLEYYESMLMVTGYCVIAYYSFQIIESLDDVYCILKWWIISLFVFALLGLSQLTSNFSFFESEIGRKLIVPRAGWGSLDKLEFKFRQTIYLTLYNPNYVGFYGALCFPFFVGHLWFNRRMKKTAILDIVLILISVLFIAGSKNSSATLTCGVTLVCFLILIRKQLLTNMKLIGIVAAASIAALVIGDFATNHTLSQMVKGIMNNITAQQLNTPLTTFETGNENVKIVYNKETLLVSYDVTENGNISYQFVDGQGQSLNTTYDSNTKALSDPRFQNITFAYEQLETLHTVIITIDGERWRVMKNLEGFEGYVHINEQLGKIAKAVSADSAVFTGRELMGSGRGYIWSRTIPLLKDNVFLGVGPCNYLFNFPQNDYAAKMNAAFPKNMMIDKPHNMYLQAGISSGVIALLCLLAFYLLYLLQSIKLYWKNNYESETAQLGVCALLANLGFLFTGLFNDSNISVSGIAWTFLGLGIVLNYLYKKELPEPEPKNTVKTNE